MAVYAPGDTPQDDTPTADPGMFARLQQYLAGLNPISSANASVLHPDLSSPRLNAALQANPNPLSNPSPVDPRLAGGGPPVPAGLGGPPPIVPGGGSSGGGGGASSGTFVQPQHPSTMRFPMWPTPPVPTAAPASPLPPSRPVTPTPTTAYPAAPAATPPARPVTPTPATAYSPGFGGIDRQNLSATGYNPGTRMGTALDLSRMFGMPSDVNPPVSGGVLSKAGTKGLISPTTGKPMPMSSADLAYGLPDARGAPYPYAVGSPRKAAAIVAAAKHSGFA